MAFLCKGQFLFGAGQQGVHSFQCLGQCGMGFGQGVKYVVAVFKHGCGAAQGIDQKTLVDEVDAGRPGEGYGMDDFLFGHSSFMK
jgi:hypothetical protein